MGEGGVELGESADENCQGGFRVRGSGFRIANFRTKRLEGIRVRDSVRLSAQGEELFDGSAAEIVEEGFGGHDGMRRIGVGGAGDCYLCEGEGGVAEAAELVADELGA